MNIRLILSMHWLKPSKRLNRPPRALWLPTIDTPITPMPIGTLRRGLEAALPVIEEGWGVLAHCRAGVHRSVAMASCVLIGMGDTAEKYRTIKKLNFLIMKLNSMRRMMQTGSRLSRHKTWPIRLFTAPKNLFKKIRSVLGATCHLPIMTSAEISEPKKQRMRRKY